jgi:hypothetical protein
LSDLLGWFFIILKENLSHSESNDNDDLHEPIQKRMSWSTITTPGGSGSGGVPGLDFSELRFQVVFRVQPQLML